VSIFPRFQGLILSATIPFHYSQPPPKWGLLPSTICVASFVLATEHRKDMRKLWPMLAYGWGRRRLRDFTLELNQLEATGLIGFRLRTRVHHASCLSHTGIMLMVEDGGEASKQGNVKRKT
jgi:hypothetical protein